MQTRCVIRTVAAAARFVDEVGLALLLPKADVVLPSLWEQVAGVTEVAWPSPEMSFLWSAKDELPAQGLACVGRHVARCVACVAPRLVPVLVAANGGAADGPVVEAVRELGPLTGPQLREATGLPKKDVDRAVASLHHALVLTSSHYVDGGSSWGAVAHDLLARKWSVPKRLPEREAARRELASLVLERAGELTAADLAGVFGWRRTEAAAVLDAVAEGRDDDGFTLYAPRR
jgi:Winged helix DNA-binding domain